MFVLPEHQSLSKIQISTEDFPAIYPTSVSCPIYVDTYHYTWPAEGRLE